MKQLASLFLVSIIILLAACSKTADYKAADQAAGFNYGATGNGGLEQTQATEEKMPAPPPDDISKKEDVNIAERKLIKNGDIAFETKSISQTKAFILKAVSKNKAYISNEKIEDYRTNPTEIITVRVPNQYFDILITEIGQEVGEFDSKRIDVDDATEEFIDMEIRLKNKKQLEGKYQELLAKATTMENILKIEKEISMIREEIESNEGRLRFLNNQVNYSTLTITYYEKKPNAGFDFGNKLADAAGNGGTGFLIFIIVLVNLWPLWLMGIILWFAIAKYMKYRKNKAAKTSAKP